MSEITNQARRQYVAEIDRLNDEVERLREHLKIFYY